MSHKAKEIEVYLSKLELSKEKVPTFYQLKKAYRDLLFQHPEEHVLEEFSEAARIVFLFLVRNTEAKTSKSEEGARMLKCFETSSQLEFHNNCLTFNIDDTHYEGWMKGLQERLGESSTLNGKGTYKYKTICAMIPW